MPRRPRTRELQVAAVRGNGDRVTELPMDPELLAPPVAETWPRTSLAVSVAPGTSTERLMAFDQASPRDPYKLWGWVQLFAGVVVPTFAKPELGSEMVAPDDATLVVTPADAVAQYVDVLNVGDGSQFAGAFPQDQLRTALASAAAANVEKLQAAKGTYTLQLSATEDPPRALRTLDGGAVVLARLSAVETLSGEPRSVVAPQTETQKAIFGSTTPTNVLKVGYVTVVALYVPRAQSTDPVTVLGATHVADTVTSG